MGMSNLELLGNTVKAGEVESVYGVHVLQSKITGSGGVYDTQAGEER